VILTLLAPTSPRPPSGGVTVIYELASAMARRGHEVHLFHADFLQTEASEDEQRDLYSSSDGVVHHFAPSGSGDDVLPESDIIFGYRSDPALPARTGLPVVLIQGYKMLDEAVERAAYHVPCPKVCVAAWLVDVGRRLGVPDRQLVHVPPGLRHEQYRVLTPIPSRPPRVSFCYSSHAQKGAALALGVLSELEHAVPELEAVAFGAAQPVHELPTWITYRMAPSQGDVIDIYNGSRVFLMTSDVEGFGLPAVEAMACGAALVTTDSGGSRDYALHDETALVSPPGDVDTMVDHVTKLLENDERRIQLAQAGQTYVERFDWDRSAEQLEAFLERYRHDPDRYA